MLRSSTRKECYIGYVVPDRMQNEQLRGAKRAESTLDKTTRSFENKREMKATRMLIVGMKNKARYKLTECTREVE